MKLIQFHDSLEQDNPPLDLRFALTALWWDAKGDWNKPMKSAQQDEGIAGAWVHAYLYRKEGDSSNAGYWYSRAGKSLCRSSLKDEWNEIVEVLLGS